MRWLDFNKALVLVFLIPMPSVHAETDRNIPASQNSRVRSESSENRFQSTSNPSSSRRFDSDDNKPMEQDDYD